MKKYLSKNVLIILFILLAGLILRTLLLEERFLYGHDQDLAGWIVKDIIIDKHLRLIGQETSTSGVFIGPLYYYLLIPFYLVTRMDPIGGTYLVTILGAIAILSFYYVFKNVFSRNVGVIAAIVYAFSFYTIFNDREVVPTQPVILWSVWFMYGLHLILTKKQKQAFLLFGLLLGLIWHINFALMLTAPLIIVAIILARSRLNFKAVLSGLALFILTSIPLFLFEIRHNFIQIKAVYQSFVTPQHDIYSGVEKLNRVIYLMSKNIAGLFMGGTSWFRFEQVMLILIGIFLALMILKKLDKKLGVLLALWIILFIGFFSSYSKIVSEYYLNATIPVWICIFSVFVASLLKSRNYNHFGAIILSLFLVYNLSLYFNSPVNKSGYVERLIILDRIQEDASKHGYPCVAVSYLTNPGYEHGWRYLYWYKNMHVNKPQSLAPTYSIVYPLKDYYNVDERIGDMGYIRPYYDQHTPESVAKSCSGDNENLKEPFFGYTE